jgi:hypothetical protein
VGIYGYCAIRGCEARASELVGGVALCEADRKRLATAFQEAGVTRPYGEVVYYVTWRGSSLVKIGTSTRLRTRLHSLSSGSRGRAILAAVEPGSFALERRRHREFRDLRKPGTELFRIAPLLTEHIREIRTDPGWLLLSGVGEEWT